MNNNNNNNIYILYKNVFTNIYLKNLIYKYVKDLNIDIIISNSKDKYPINNARRNYYECTFEWIVENKEYPILYDWYRNYNNESIIQNYKIQNYQLPLITKFLKHMNKIIKSNEKDELLSSTSNSNNNNNNNNNNKKIKKLYLNKPTNEFIKDLLFKFWTLNKSILVQYEIYPISECSVSRIIKNKTIANSGRVQKPGGVQYVDLLQVSVFSSNFEFLKLVYQDHFISKKHDLKIDNLLAWAIANGDIESLKYLYYTMGIKEIKYGCPLETACIPENSEEVIQFLVNDLKFSSSIIKTTNFISFLQPNQLKFLQIDNQLFSKFPHASKLTLDENVSLESLPFKNFLNVIQNLYCTKSIEFSNHLNFILNYQKQDTTNQQQYYCFNTSNTGFFNGLISIFKQPQQQFLIDDDDQDNLITRFDLINFKNFNLEREVKRLYIYYIFLNFQKKSSLYSILEVAFKFISDYKEYDLMKQLLNPFDCFLSKTSFFSKSTVDFEHVKFNYLTTATNHTDLFIYIHNNFRDQFHWGENIAHSVVKNNNLDLLKYFIENSIPIKPNIIDSTHLPTDILKYLLSNNFMFSESSIYNCLRYSRIDSFSILVSHIPSPSTKMTMNSVCNTINNYYQFTYDNIAFRKEIKYLIDIGKLDSNLLSINSKLIDLSLKLPNFLIKEKDF